MGKFFIGFILAIIIAVLFYFVFLVPQPIQIIQTIIITDTLYVQTTNTIQVVVQKIVPKIIYLDPDSLSYVATIDTTIVQPRVTAEISTSFYHPEKLFDLNYKFEVKSDSVFVHTTQIITKIIPIDKKPTQYIINPYYLNKNQKSIYGLGIGIIYKRIGANIKGQTDQSIGAGLLFKF